MKQLLGLALAIVFFTSCKSLETAATAGQKPIDTSVVFTKSRTYLEKAKQPGMAPLRLLSGEETRDYRAVSLHEDHPTHIVTLAHLRVYRDGRISVRKTGAVYEECWVDDRIGD